MRPCKVEGCLNKSKTPFNSMCSMHHHRRSRLGHEEFEWGRLPVYPVVRCLQLRGWSDKRIRRAMKLTWADWADLDNATAALPRCDRWAVNLLGCHPAELWGSSAWTNAGNPVQYEEVG